MVNVIKDHTLALFKKGKREDNRAFDEYRATILEYSISPKSAEGSARVKIGKTEVIAGVKVEIGKPYPDRPSEGTIIVNAELLPLSSPEFESGPPSIDSIEISRVVDRAIREGHALDFKKLCIKEGEQIWIVLIDIYPLNDDGNLFDAAALAALAALKDARFPKVENDIVQYGDLTDQKLPLERLPVSCTVLKVGDQLLVDPSHSEESFADARLTVAILDDGQVCAMQKGGNAGLSFEEIEQMISLASAKTKELREILQK